MLRGARLVTSSETEEGKAWAEARIKLMTGGDEISARFMRQDFFTFRPQFKLTIVGNHKPVLQNIDEAARRTTKFLSAALLSRGYGKKRMSGGATAYTGLMLKLKNRPTGDD
jgi:hypothetical protein